MKNALVQYLGVDFCFGYYGAEYFIPQTYKFFIDLSFGIGYNNFNCCEVNRNPCSVICSGGAEVQKEVQTNGYQ